MHELMAAEQAPAPHLVGFFFLSFTVLCVFLVINLFVSVVVVAVQKNEEEAWDYKQGQDADFLAQLAQGKASSGSAVRLSFGGGALNQHGFPGNRAGPSSLEHFFC